MGSKPLAAIWRKISSSQSQFWWGNLTQLYFYVITYFSGTKLQTCDKHPTRRSKLRQCFSQQFSKSNFKVFFHGQINEKMFILLGKLYSSWIPCNSYLTNISLYFRWIKLRSAMVPYTACLEPFSECMLSGALASLSSYILFKTDPICFYLVHVLVWFICDWILIHIVQVTFLSISFFQIFCESVHNEHSPLPTPYQ